MKHRSSTQTTCLRRRFAQFLGLRGHGKKRVLATLVVALFSSLAVSQLMALESDRDQPADIQADDIEFDFKNGKRTYLNNVIAVQGSMRLKADKLIADYANSQLQKAIMWGSLARFKQRPDGKSYDVQGWAEKMIVDQQANTITLIGQAALQQGPDTARGETIVYNMATDTLQVKGGAKIGSGGASGEARPNKKLEDPFKDDELPPPPPPSQSTVKAQQTIAEQTSKEASTASTTPVAAPTSSGRSRLILRPRKKPVENDDADDEQASDDDRAVDDDNDR